MARRFVGVGRFATRRQGPRRETQWIAGTFTNNTLAVNSVTLLTSLNAAALALRPFTIVRTRGIFQFASDQETVSENYGISYGEIIVSEQASAAGVGSVPTPETESGSDWHVFEQGLGRLAVSSAIGIWETGFQKEIDSKAMRKVDLGEDLIVVVEVPASGPSEGVLFRSFVRTLIKLH